MNETRGAPSPAASADHIGLMEHNKLKCKWIPVLSQAKRPIIGIR